MESNFEPNYFCAPAAEWLPKVWVSKDVLMCSLIAEGCTIPPHIRHIDTIKRSIVASAPVTARRMVMGVFYDADRVYFTAVSGPPIGAILVRWGNVPLFVCTRAVGLPIVPIGWDIHLNWQDFPPYIAKLPDAEATC